MNLMESGKDNELVDYILAGIPKNGYLILDPKFRENKTYYFNLKPVNLSGTKFIK